MTTDKDEKLAVVLNAILAFVYAAGISIWATLVFCELAGIRAALEAMTK